MASLTPLSKGLIALAVVGAMSSAVWHLGLKGWLAERDAAIAQNGGSTPVDTTGLQKPFPVPQLDTPSRVPVDIDPGPPPSLPSPGRRPSGPPDDAPAVNSGSTSPARMSVAENSETGRRLVNGGKFAQARPYLEQAVKDGDGQSTCLLGEMTLKGQGGITADHEKAGALFRLAQSRNIICFASGG
ncbi:MAG: hypothetical protein EOO28_04340 [Comamonadaceae bacterium]|nr:MAG: hypothetical protein EOO28_04340 [Comamonadaceae bacterium]